MQLARAAVTALRHQQVFPALFGVSYSRLFSSSGPYAAEQHHTTPEALREFRENVHEFAQTVVAPHAEHVDKSNNFPTDVDLWKEMGQFGLLGVTAPEEFGGLDMGYQAHCIAMEVSAQRNYYYLNPQASAQPAIAIPITGISVCSYRKQVYLLGGPHPEAHP
eukprot:GHRQ01008184.1.p1 GENE.GHRQ01008184.1~~GHRQ01008184.1.p1  ORF type:complete len:163 (+),score=18.37 GHRQ01008184.1:204-692(+)